MVCIFINQSVLCIMGGKPRARSEGPVPEVYGSMHFLRAACPAGHAFNEPPCTPADVLQTPESHVSSRFPNFCARACQVTTGQAPPSAACPGQHLLQFLPGSGNRGGRGRCRARARPPARTVLVPTPLHGELHDNSASGPEL